MGRRWGAGGDVTGDLLLNTVCVWRAILFLSAKNKFNSWKINCCMKNVTYLSLDLKLEFCVVITLIFSG